MTPEIKKEIDALKAQVKELMEWKKARVRQQFEYPLDKESMRVLNEAFLFTTFTKVNVFDIYFQAQTSKPTVRGQMRYYDDLTTQQFQVRTSTNPPDAANFTGSINLTAI